MRKLMIYFLILGATVLCEVCEAAKIDRFNYVLGTQTFGARYQFTNDSKLVETARAILEMGSNTIKFAMTNEYGDRLANVPQKQDGIDSLLKLARDEPSHKQVLDMPFANYLIWVYPFSPMNWRDGVSEEEKQGEYKEIYDLSCYLLKKYSGTGKSFYLGHWEGDWHLRSDYNTRADISDQVIQGMIEWLNIRQRAVDDAKRDTKHKDVYLYNYTEVNLVKIGLDGARCLTNSVLPKTNVDYVSYSSYDTEWDSEQLKKALDYIEAHLPVKPQIKGKRVFIGEYGFPASSNSPEKQDEMSRKVAIAALEWGCPFVLYWEMYNNEDPKETGNGGFWMIDDKGVKQPVYYTHQAYYKWAKNYVQSYNKAHKKQPTPQEFSKEAAKYLRSLDKKTD